MKDINEANEMGWEAIERLRFLASLPLAGNGQREGGEKTKPFNRFQSRLGTNKHAPLHPTQLMLDYLLS